MVARCIFVLLQVFEWKVLLRSDALDCFGCVFIVQQAHEGSLRCVRIQLVVEDSCDFSFQISQILKIQ